MNNADLLLLFMAISALVKRMPDILALLEAAK